MHEIAPGVYLSENGERIRAEIPEIIKALGVSDTRATRRALSRYFVKLFKNMFPDAIGKVTR